MRRLLAALVVSLILVAPQARAAKVYYELKNISSQDLSLVQAEIVPPGVVAPADNTRPIGLVESQSSGYAPGSVIAGLGQGQGVQGLTLLFGIRPVLDTNGQVVRDPQGQEIYDPILDAHNQPVGGLKPGGTLMFWLNVSDPTTPPQLLPRPTVKDLVQFASVPAPSRTEDSAPVPTDPTPTPTPTPTSAPEPLSLVLWSTVSGLGLAARVRSYRRLGKRRV